MQTLPARTTAVNVLPGARPRREHAYRRVPGDADETITRLDHDLNMAEVWTTRKSIVRRLRRLGATQQDRVGPGVWLRIAAPGAIKFRNRCMRKASDATRVALAAARAARGARDRIEPRDGRTPGCNG